MKLKRPPVIVRNPGCARVIKKFAWLPVYKSNGDGIWLEFFNVEQKWEYTPTTISNEEGDYHWVDNLYLFGTCDTGKLFEKEEI